MSNDVEDLEEVDVPEVDAAKIEADRQALLEILDCPIRFTAACWPDIVLTDYQRDILLSLKNNVETFVHAANEVGKDFTSAIGCIWFFCSRRPARVITSSSGETQLKNILWSEINHRISTSRIKFPFKVGSLEIRWILKDGTLDKLSYMIGHVTNSVENFQGHHLDHDIPRVLALFDEASGVADEYNEAADSWAHRKLVIGNPLNCLNFFFRACKGGDIAHDDPDEPGLLRKILHIDGELSPNVILGKRLKGAGIKGPYPSIVPGVLSYAEYMRRKRIWDAIKIHIRLHGKFYEGEAALMFPPDWLDRTEKAHWELHPTGYNQMSPRIVTNPSTHLAMGIDCGAGRDLSVWTIIDRLGIVFQHAESTFDTSIITKKTIEFIERFFISPAKICFDAGGGGKQIVDHMRDQNPKYKLIRSIAFGSSPTQTTEKKSKKTDDKITEKEDTWVYKNRRAELYGDLRKWIDPSINQPVFALPEELYLMREELAILPLWFDSNGKMYLPPKDKAPHAKDKEEITLKKLLGRSPDRSDSLVLAVHAHQSKGKRLLGALRA